MSAGLFDLDGMHRSAVISDDGLYRYRLIRSWGPGALLPFVMLNPSTADGRQDDPTIRCCIGFAKRLGFDGVAVWNLYAFRATDPHDLWAAARDGVDIVGPDNDRRLRNLLAWAEAAEIPVVAAWGANGRVERVRQLLEMPGATAFHSLGVTRAGAPKHPLARGLHRIPDDATPVPWSLHIDTQETR